MPEIIETHTISQCPLRSMAWITVDSTDQTVKKATREMIQILGYDPTHQSISTVWDYLESDQTYTLTKTHQTLRTLCVCVHEDEYNDQQVLICTDVTQLQRLSSIATTITNNSSSSNDYYHQQAPEKTSIARLTMYGTIDAIFLTQELQECGCELSIGQPMMRYIHSDDVKTFCAGLNETSKLNTMASFHARLLSDNDSQQKEIQWAEFTVMSIDSGRQILCLIKSVVCHTDDEEDEGLEQTTITTTVTNNMLLEAVTHIQDKFWSAIDHGMTFLASQLAQAIMLVVQMVWQIWYDKNNNNGSASWTGLFATSSEYMLRKVVKCTKERPEVDKVFRLVSWAGLISHSTSKAWFDNTLDNTFEWLISKAFHQVSECDAII